jgi:hypothetical protein
VYSVGKDAAEICGTVYNYAETHPIYSHVMLERSFETSLVKDSTTTWSFECALPTNLPPTLLLGSPESTNRRKPGQYASVSYQVKVVIEQHGFLKDSVTTFEQPVHVVKNPKQAIKSAQAVYEYIPPVDVVPQKSFFGFQKNPRGKVYIAARLPDGVHVRAGQDFFVDLSIINCSKATIERVEIKLHKLLHWQAHGRVVDLNHLMVTKIVGWLGVFVPYPPPAKAVVTAKDPIQIKQQMKRELIEATHRQLLSIPVQTQSSYRGKLLRVTYLLVIHVKTKQRFIAPSDVEIPLVVHETPL